MDRVNETRICYLCEKTVAIIDLTQDDKLVCEHCGAERRVKDYLPAGEATYKGSPQAAATANPTLQRSTDILRWLPMAFYLIACLGFMAFLILAVQAERGADAYLFGYGIGTTIACLGGGRVIELLQNIDDELYRKRISE